MPAALRCFEGTDVLDRVLYYGWIDLFRLKEVVEEAVLQSPILVKLEADFPKHP